ncbi:hypothetical protein A7X12_24550 [Sphingomonas sp. TDK1]|nr:hypothetical protein A7X12_24550 [Sphingomonas sp. TDK1]
MSFWPFCGEMRTPFRPDRCGHGVHDLHEKARAVLDAAAVRVGASVRAIAQELVDQVAVGGVHLDAVEPGGERVLGALSVLRDNAGNFGCLQRTGRRDRLEAFFGEGLGVGLDGGGCDRQRASRLERGMRDAPHVPERATMTPPATCTALVTIFQPSIWAWLWIPGVAI